MVAFVLSIIRAFVPSIIGVFVPSIIGALFPQEGQGRVGFNQGQGVNLKPCPNANPLWEQRPYDTVDKCPIILGTNAPMILGTKCHDYAEDKCPHDTIHIINIVLASGITDKYPNNRELGGCLQVNRKNMRQNEIFQQSFLTSDKL